METSQQCNLNLEELILNSFLVKDGKCYCGAFAFQHPRKIPLNNGLVQEDNNLSPAPAAAPVTPPLTSVIAQNSSSINNISSLSGSSPKSKSHALLPTSDLLDGRLVNVSQQYGFKDSSLFQSLKPSNPKPKDPFKPFDQFLSALTAAEHELYPHLVKGFVISRRNKLFIKVKCRANKHDKVCRFEASASKYHGKNIPDYMEACRVSKCFLYHDCQTPLFLETISASHQALEVKDDQVPIKVQVVVSECEILTDVESNMKEKEVSDRLPIQKVFYSVTLVENFNLLIHYDITIDTWND